MQRCNSIPAPVVTQASETMDEGERGMEMKGSTREGHSYLS